MFNKFSAFISNQNHQKEDEEFLTDVNSANLYGISIRSHLILWIFFIFVVCAIIWSYYATLDEITHASGKTIPSSQVQIVQNLEGGILSEILIKEGDLVEKDQTLLKLDSVRFASSFNETKLKYYELLATAARLRAEVNKKNIIIPDEVKKKYPSIAKDAIRLLKSRQQNLKANRNIIEEQIRQRKQDITELNSKSNQISSSYKLLKEELEMSRPLVAEGAMSRVELLRLQRTANDLRGELTSTRLAIPRLKSSLNEARSKLSELKIRFHTEALEELNRVKAELDRTTESVISLEDRVSRTRVLSPVKGTIKQLKISTIGGVIQPGMDLVEIVPLDDQLLIEAEIRPADIAFLRPGQKAVIKLTAYDFSIYGGLDATLKHISADTIINEEDGKSYYLIRLKTNKNYLERHGEKLSIISGMTADVDILTGKKSVLDYMLKPILKAKERSLTER